MDWWVLVTRPLGMAPREPLERCWITERDERQDKGGNTTQNRWHAGPAQKQWEPFRLGAARGFI